MTNLLNTIPAWIAQPVAGAAIFALLVFAIWKIYKLFNRDKSDLPAGRIGYPVQDIAGIRHVETLMIGMTIAYKEDNGSGTGQGFWAQMWNPIGTKQHIGLRSLLDSFYNVEMVFDSNNSYFQAVPFENIAVLYEDHQIGNAQINLICEQFKADFEPLVEGKLNPKIRVFPGFGDTPYVFFGREVFVPNDAAELPIGEVYVKNGEKTYPVVMGKAKQSGSERLAAYYRKQNSVYFSVLDKRDGQIQAKSHASVWKDCGLETNLLYGIVCPNEISQSARLITMELYSHANNNGDTPDKQGDKTSHWCVVEKNLRYGLEKEVKIDDLEYSYNFDLKHLPGVNVVATPNTAYSRLRKNKKSFPGVPYFEILGLILPNPDRDLFKITSIAFFSDALSGMAGTGISRIDQAIIFDRITKNISSIDGENAKTIGRLDSLNRPSSIFAYQLLDTNVAEDGINCINQMQSNNTDSGIISQLSLPPRKFIYLTRNHPSPLGYFGLPMRPDGKAEEGWLNSCKIQYCREDSDAKGKNGILLDWLDNAVEVEMTNPDGDGTDRIGFARWFGREARSSFEGNDPLFYAFTRSQSMVGRNGEVFIEDVEDTIEDKTENTKLTDKCILRIGPLIVRYQENLPGQLPSNQGEY